MSTMFGMNGETVSEYPSYTAPKQHGEKLLDPALGEVLGQFHSTLTIQQEANAHFSGGNHWLTSIKQSARRKLLQSAEQYTSGYRDTPNFEADSGSKIVMSGHQPDLFHCGVWFKNFILSNLGQAHNAIPIHFIVDNDLCRSAGIEVPLVVDGKVGKRLLNFDTLAPPMPWENRRLQDVTAWQSFAERIRAECPKLSQDPLIGNLWSHAVRLDKSAPLGILLSQARHLLEKDLGLRTLEVPLSQMVSTLEFAQFSWVLVSQLPRFQQIYNAELEHYRAAHRIRNHAQPLPNLDANDGWLEAPFWCYSESALTREPLWVRRASNRFLLSDRRNWEQSFPLTDELACEQWLNVLTKGIRLRPRALITTMYSRLVLSDLFIHGIGGGKYDQITDRIVASFFGWKAPPYLVASATMRLQFDDLPSELRLKQDGELVNNLQERNAVEANPELLLKMNLTSISNQQRAQLQHLAEQKQALLAAIPSKGEKWEWHVAMKKVKRQLLDLAQPYVRQLREEHDRLRRVSEQQAVLSSREYSFSLFSLDEIKKHFAASDLTGKN